MNALLATLLSYLLLYKYFALFLISFLASLILPLPSDISLVAAAAFAEQGYLNVFLVFVTALAGSVLGDLTGFFIARRYGREALNKIGFRKMLASKRFNELETYISNRPGQTIFTTRFVGQIGPLVNIIAGLSSIKFKKYFLYEFLGELSDVVLLGVTGYFLGDEWQSATKYIEYIGAVLLVIVIIVIVKKVYYDS
jgi:membrane protein DedA with SNARE-associated domain